MFDKLVSGLYGLKPFKGNRVLHSGVVGVKGDNILHPHIGQLLKSQGAVQRLSPASLMLSALIEEGHNHIDPAGLSSHRRDQSLQILIMIIRRHVVHLSAHGIGETVIADVNQQIQINQNKPKKKYVHIFKN